MRYAIVPDQSQVWIDATSSVHPIHSHTGGLEGFLELTVLRGGRLNLKVQPEGRLALPVARLASGNPLQDREMRRRIDARRYRTIDGVLTGLRSAGAAGRYLVAGDLTFKGVTRHYENEMTITVVDDSTIKMEGEATFDIRDFGMEPPRILMLRVHPEVKVRVEIVATKEA